MFPTQPQAGRLEGVEEDFRAGSMSNRKIAEWYGVSEGAVRKRAKADGWVRTGTQGRTLRNRRGPDRAAPAGVGAGEPGRHRGQSLGLVAQLLGELQA